MSLRILILVAFLCNSFCAGMQARWESVALRPVAARQQAMGKKWAHLQSQRKRPRKLMSAKKRTWWRTAVALGIPSVLLLLKLAAMYKNKKSTLSLMSPAPTPEILPVATSFAVVSSPPQPGPPVLTQHVELQSQQASGALGLSTFVDQSTPPLMLPVESPLALSSLRDEHESNEAVSPIKSIQNPEQGSLLQVAREGSVDDFIRKFYGKKKDILVQDSEGKNVLHYIAKRFYPMFHFPDNHEGNDFKKALDQILRLQDSLFDSKDRSADMQRFNEVCLLGLSKDRLGSYPFMYLLDVLTISNVGLLQDFFYPFFFCFRTDWDSLKREDKKIDNEFFEVIWSFIVDKVKKNDYEIVVALFRDLASDDCRPRLLQLFISRFKLEFFHVFAAFCVEFKRSALSLASSILPCIQIQCPLNSNWAISYTSDLFFPSRVAVQFLFGRLPDHVLDAAEVNHLLESRALNPDIKSFIKWCVCNPLELDAYRLKSPWPSYDVHKQKKVTQMMDLANAVGKATYSKTSREMKALVHFIRTQKLDLTVQDEHGQNLAHKGFDGLHRLEYTLDVNWLTPSWACKAKRDHRSLPNLFKAGLTWKNITGPDS